MDVETRIALGPIGTEAIEIDHRASTLGEFVGSLDVDGVGDDRLRL